MTTAWQELADSPRWRALVAFVRQWVGPFDATSGMAPERLDAVLQTRRLELPAPIREWYLLAGAWSQGGLCLWIRPSELVVQGGRLTVLTDVEGITAWQVRAADFRHPDPPVFSADDQEQADYAAFTEFVVAMVANDFLFGADEEPAELNAGKARAALQPIVSARYGDVLADGPLASAEVIAYAYADNGPVDGKARTAAGQQLLARLRA